MISHLHVGNRFVKFSYDGYNCSVSALPFHFVTSELSNTPSSPFNAVFVLVHHADAVQVHGGPHSPCRQPRATGRPIPHHNGYSLFSDEH